MYGLGRPGGVQLAETGQTRRGACLVEGVELNFAYLPSYHEAGDIQLTVV